MYVNLLNEGPVHLRHVQVIHTAAATRSINSLAPPAQLQILPLDSVISAFASSKDDTMDFISQQHEDDSTAKAVRAAAATSTFLDTSSDLAISRSPLTKLPIELKRLIFEHLDPVSSPCLGLASRHFYPIHRSIWGTVRLPTKFCLDCQRGIPIGSPKCLCDNIWWDDHAAVFRNTEKITHLWDFLKVWIGEEYALQRDGKLFIREK